ncbi:unknown similar to AMEV063 [Mythimna separata entomopoxvirus 'L']|uniref:Peptidase C14 caspase domain-containing protein n=1 Tax=Mythimna separata entomopoxvirus 'L' TaxID=1293572 RepID=A0A916KQ30_9POXV|nr:unknown similar to AMEV063 [Mythimna separata entomopoxvirus 'L']CCU56255.1 unknown similar to AMEV063 [Mythimna separata entomopoxvirus 'L']
MRLIMDQNNKENYLLIFNNYSFESNRSYDYLQGNLNKNIEESEKLQKLFCDELCFKKIICDNYTHDKIIDTISETLIKFENEKPKIIIICILSYFESGKIYSSDIDYPLQDIIRPFTLNKNLINIPKLYFIQTTNVKSTICCRRNDGIELIGYNTLILRSLNDSKLISLFCSNYKKDYTILEICNKIQTIPPSFLILSTLKDNYI